MISVTRRRQIASLLVFLVLLAWPLPTVSAHANLVRSDPPAGAALAESPPAITLTYSEDLDPTYTHVQLVDSSGGLVVGGPGVIPPGAPRILQLDLVPLPAGIYSAVWQARSAIDGHETQGIVGFTVGLAAGSSASLLLLLPQRGAPDPATALPASGSTLLRWASYLAAALLIGSLAFGLLVWRPSFLSNSPGSSEVDGSASDSLQLLAAAGLVGLAVFSLIEIITEVALAGHLAVWSALPALGEYLGGSSGVLLGLRFVSIGVVAFLLNGLSPIGTGKVARWLGAFVLSSLLLLTFSVQSHSAARAGVLGIILDWEHLMAMAIWLGGLLPLVLIMRLARRHDGPPLSSLIPRFSAVAILCVITLAVTGLLNALPLVQTTGALASTTAGRALAVKVGLFGLLVGLGAVNLLILSPRLRTPNGSAGRRLGLTVRVEIVLGLLVVAAASVMMQVAPAHDALAASRQFGPVEWAHIGKVDLTLRVAPGQVGGNAFGVDVTDARSEAAKTPGQVVLRLWAVDHPAAGVTEVTTDTQDGKRYTAAGSYLTLAGRWKIQVILRRSGFDDVSQVFDLPVGVTPASSAGAAGPAGGPQAGGLQNGLLTWSKLP